MTLRFNLKEPIIIIMQIAFALLCFCFCFCFCFYFYLVLVWFYIGLLCSKLSRWSRRRFNQRIKGAKKKSQMKNYVHWIRVSKKTDRIIITPSTSSSTSTSTVRWITEGNHFYCFETLKTFKWLNNSKFLEEKISFSMT